MQFNLSVREDYVPTQLPRRARRSTLRRHGLDFRHPTSKLVFPHPSYASFAKPSLR